MSCHIVRATREKTTLHLTDMHYTSWSLRESKIIIYKVAIQHSTTSDAQFSNIEYAGSF